MSFTRIPRHLLAWVVVTWSMHATVAPACAADGDLDLSFSGTGKQRITFDLGSTFKDYGTDVAVDAKGRVVVAGIVKDAGGVERWALARTLANGGLDTSFSADGRVVITDFAADIDHPPVVAVWSHPYDPNANSMVIAGGAVAMSGTVAAFCVLFEDGSTAASCVSALPGWYSDVELFGTNMFFGGTVQGVGTDRDMLLEKRLAFGAFGLDPSWGGAGAGRVAIAYDVPGGTARDELGAIALTPDRELVVVGSRSNGAGDQDWVYLKLNTAGTTPFLFEQFQAFPGAADDLALGLALARDESFAIVGQTSGGTPTYAFVSADGSVLESHLTINGTDLYNDAVFQDDGKLVVSGSGLLDTGFLINRFLRNGLPDPTFGASGFTSYQFTDGPGGDHCGAKGIALQGGRIVAGGSAEWNNLDLDFGVMRLTAAPVFADGFETGTTYFWSQP